jgi:hypothetical protein
MPPSLTPQSFVEKWRQSALKERSASQEHFIDVCRMVGHLTPAELDPSGGFFTFEAGAAKTAGAWTPGPTLPLGLHGFPLLEYEWALFILGDSGLVGDVGSQGVVWALRLPAAHPVHYSNRSPTPGWQPGRATEPGILRNRA